MKQPLFLLYSLLLCNQLTAQSLGEDPVLSYYRIPGQQIGGANIAKRWQLANNTAFVVGAYYMQAPRGAAEGLFGVLYPKADYSYKGFSIDTKASQFGEIDHSFSCAIKEFDWVSNLHWLDNKIDLNKDRFLDLPRKQRIYNKIDIGHYFGKDGSKNHNIYFTGEHLYLRERGGQTAFYYPSDYLGSHLYGTGVLLHQASLRGGCRIYPQGYGKSNAFRVSASGNYTYLRQFFGQRQHIAQHQGASIEGIYDWSAKNGFDYWTIGASYKYSKTNEKLDSNGAALVDLQRVEHQVGGLIEYKGLLAPHFVVQPRLNAYYHSLAGLVLAPRLELAYEFAKFLEVGLYGVGGMRYINPLSDYSPYLLSSRRVEIRERLLPERAWQYGLTANYSQYLASIRITANLDAGQRFYTNAVVADLDSDVNAIQFYNTKKSRNDWIELDICAQRKFRDFGHINLNIDYRFDRTQQQMQDGETRRMPLYPLHRVGLSLDWRAKYIIVFMGYNAYMGQRLPSLLPKFDNSLKAPVMHRWDVRVDFPLNNYYRSYNKDGSHKLDKLGNYKYSVPHANFWLYIGIDNILDIRQTQPFIGASQPFTAAFDGTQRWGTTVGRRFYMGLKYKF